jgi:diacylglycerol kinase (ATP)
VKRRIQFIINPVSGSRRSMDVVLELTRKLRQDGDVVSMYKTQCPGDARRFSEAIAHDVDVVVTVGGDGTVSEVVHGLSEHPIPIVVLPTGTENLLSQEFGLRADADLLYTTLNANCRQWIDVGVVNGRRFMIVAGIGFDAEVVRRLVEDRRGHITHLTYFWPLWRTFWSHRFPSFRVAADGETVFEGRGLVFVGNISRYAIGLKLLRDAVCDDGLLDLCVFPCRWQAGLLYHAACAALRKHVARGQVIYRHCREIVVDSDEKISLEVDGDLAGYLPATFNIIERRGIFLVPPPRFRKRRWLS